MQKQFKNIQMITITPYKIRRNHDNKTRFFIVNVPEVKQRGVGFQVNINGTLYGVSLHSKAVKQQQ